MSNIKNEKKHKNTIDSGNTKPSQSTRARHYQLTLNDVNKYDEIKNYLTQLTNMKYLISCKERAPTTNHEHIHIYVQFSNPRTLKFNKLCGSHVEKCYGTPKQNRDYIIKDGNIIDEIGEFKSNGGISGLSIKDVKNMNDDELDNLPLHYFNTIEKIKNKRKNLNIKSVHKNVNVIYIYGKSGSGKSKNGYELLNQFVDELNNFDEVVYINGFWNGISENCKCCIYDDFRDTDMKPNEFIKFIDYNKHIMNVKGNYVVNNYKIIIITSIFPPWELYKNKTDEQKKQWLRRLEIYECENNKINRVNFENYIFDDVIN